MENSAGLLKSTKTPFSKLTLLMGSQLREEGARGKKRLRNTGERERQEGERGREREKQGHNYPSQTSSSTEDRVYGTRPRKRPKADAREGPCPRADAGDDGSSRRPLG